MQIESRVTDIAIELQLNGSKGNVTSRQRSDTSDPSGDASRDAATQKRYIKNAVESKAPKDASMDGIDLKITVEKLNKLILDQQKDVAFSVDEEANTTVIKFFKTKTGELIKQYPPEEILAMKAKLRELTGWLVDTKA